MEKRVQKEENMDTAVQALRRREQNRQAQHALRKRRERRIQDLEKEIKTMQSTYSQTMAEIERENETLKATINELQWELSMARGANPALKKLEKASPPTLPPGSLLTSFRSGSALDDDDRLEMMIPGEFALHKPGRQKHMRTPYPVHRITNHIEAWEYVRERYDVEEVHNSGLCDAVMSQLVGTGLDEIDFEKILRQCPLQRRK